MARLIRFIDGNKAGAGSAGDGRATLCEEEKSLLEEYGAVRRLFYEVYPASELLSDVMAKREFSQMLCLAGPAGTWHHGSCDDLA